MSDPVNASPYFYCNDEFPFLKLAKRTPARVIISYVTRKITFKNPISTYLNVICFNYSMLKPFGKTEKCNNV